MKRLAISSALAAMFFASAPAQSTELFTGDVKLACEAVLCLSTGQRPDECSPAIEKYFSIKFKKASKTAKARQDFLSLCPTAPMPETPSLTAQAETDPALLAREAIEAEIAAKWPTFLQYCPSLSTTYLAAYECRRTGSLEQCSSEIDAYMLARNPAFVLLDRVNELRDQIGAAPQYCNTVVK